MEEGVYSGTTHPMDVTQSVIGRARVDNHGASKKQKFRSSVKRAEHTEAALCAERKVHKRLSKRISRRLKRCPFCEDFRGDHMAVEKHKQECFYNPDTLRQCAWGCVCVAKLAALEIHQQTCIGNPLHIKPLGGWLERGESTKGGSPTPTWPPQLRESEEILASTLEQDSTTVSLLCENGKYTDFVHVSLFCFLSLSLSLSLSL